MIIPNIWKKVWNHQPDKLWSSPIDPGNSATKWLFEAFVHLNLICDFLFLLGTQDATKDTCLIGFTNPGHVDTVVSWWTCRSSMMLMQFIVMKKSDPRVALKEHLPSGKLTISMAIFNGKSTINGHFQ